MVTLQQVNFLDPLRGYATSDACSRCATVCFVKPEYEGVGILGPLRGLDDDTGGIRVRERELARQASVMRPLAVRDERSCEAVRRAAHIVQAGSVRQHAVREMMLTDI